MRGEPSWWAGATFCAKAAWLTSTGRAKNFSEACSMLAKRRRKATPPVIPKNTRLPYAD